jgi:hypothetical protein
MNVGYFLSSEEWGPRELVAQAVKTQAAGFEGLWISDHFYPWNDEQGHSPFVWSTIGADRQRDRDEGHDSCHLPDRAAPSRNLAQAAATSAILLDGRFCLGVGSGEALNERIFGDRWPEADEPLEMLEEAVGVIRLLWEGGVHDHRGRHFRLEHCRVYDAAADRDLGLRAKGDRVGGQDRRRLLHRSPRRRISPAIPFQSEERGLRAGWDEGLLGRRREPSAQDRPPPVARRGAPGRARAGPAHGRAFRAS